METRVKQQGIEEAWDQCFGLEVLATTSTRESLVGAQYEMDNKDDSSVLRSLQYFYFSFASATCSCQNPSLSTAKLAAFIVSSFCFSVSCCSFNALFEDFFDTLSAANPALTSIRLANSANQTMLACMLFKVDLQFLSLAAALSLILVFLASFAA